MPIRLAQLKPCLLALALLCPCPFAPSASAQRAGRQKTSVKDLSPFFQHWLEEEVPYILSTDERQEFLALHSDVERDNFINAFWEARNPNPGADYNNFKEEHYRRLAYASEHFGSRRYQDGWRTEMGRIYIVLGPPKATQTYHLNANIRDLELWFYASSTPALPAFFNILFFRPGVGEDYKVYSPVQDGPYRLVTTGQQNNKAAMRVIAQQLGPELEHAALSLLPSEPVDLDTDQPSNTSDTLLATIRTLADSPEEKRRLTAARARESATTSIVVAPGPADLETTVLRDDRNRLTLSYLLRNHTPNPALVGLRPDGSTGYSLTLRSRLTTPAGTPVYEQQNNLDGTLSAPQATVARTRDFGAEDRLPILPGTYQLEIGLRNNLTAESTLYHFPVTIPAPDAAANAFAISALEAYSRASPTPDPTHALPFSVAGLRFAPRSVGVATIHTGDRLPIVFQLHLPTPTPAAPRPATVQVHYVFGSISGNGALPTEVDETVSTDSADPAGNIVNGHTLDTFELAPGFYRVVVRASGIPGSPAVASTLQLRVVPAATPIDLWTAYGPETPSSVSADDLKRGLAASAMGHPEEAATWYAAALREYPDNPRALADLAQTLAVQHKFAALADLAGQSQLTRATDPAVVLLIVNSLDATAATPAAIALAERQITLQPPTADLLNALATYYTHQGNRARAQEYSTRAAALVRGK